MSIINRNNYEIYFLDYLEGNLSPELKQEMELFLMNNTDLKEELDGLEDAVLPEDKIVFQAKESLKFIALPKRPERFITDDEFLIAKIEGDLTAEEEHVFETYLKGNPAIEKEYSFYRLTILEPDQSLIFEFKSTLKRLEITPKYYSLRKLSYAIASVAAVLLVIFFFFFFFDREESPLIPYNTNYLILIHRSSENQENVMSENKYSLGGLSENVQAENKVIKIDIKVQGNLQAYSTPVSRNIKNTANEEPQNKTELPQISKIEFDENLYPDIQKIAKIQDQIDNNKAQEVSKEIVNTTNNKQNQTRLPQNPKKKVKSDKGNLTLWDLAVMGVRGISNLSGKKIELKQHYDADGNVKSLAFNSSKIEFSAPVKKK